MRVTIQRCWHGSDKYSYRALICGGLHIYTDREWCRSVATEMLDLICMHVPTVNRSSIRFNHV